MRLPKANDYKQAASDVLSDYNVEIMRVLNNARKRAAVHTDEEVRQRANDFFEACMLKGVLPDLASLAISLGISKNTMESWARGSGCSASRREVIQECYTTIEAAQLQASTVGGFNPILWMFLAKSKYGYREDGTTPGLGGTAVIDSGSTTAEIADRYNRPLNVTLPSLEQHDDELNVFTPPIEKAAQVIDADDIDSADTEEADGTFD